MACLDHVMYMYHVQVWMHDVDVILVWSGITPLGIV